MIKPDDFDKQRILRDTNPQQYTFIKGEFQEVEVEIRHQWGETLNGWGFEPEPVAVIEKQIYVFQAITYMKRGIPYLFVVKHVIGDTDWTIFIPDYPSLIMFLNQVRPLPLLEAPL